MSIQIFGDSFSTPFNLNYNVDLRFCVDYIKSCLNDGEIPKDWIELLRESGRDVSIYSIPGTDNLTIFESILRKIPLLKENDIVIVGWSTLERVRSYETINNFVTGEEMFMSVLLGFENDKYVIEKISEHETFFNEWLLYKELHPKTSYELLNWIDIINELLKEKNITPIHWFWNPYQFGYNKHRDSSFQNLHVYDRLMKTKGFINLHFGDEGLWNQHEENPILWNPEKCDFCSYKTAIYYTTKRKVNDCHWDVNGHQIFFNIINEEIKKITN